MPYGRKKYRTKAAVYRRRRRYRAARGFRKKTYTKRAIVAERRFDSGIQGGTQGSAAGTIYNLITLPRGDDDGDREGNKILLKSLQVTVHAYNNTDSNSNTQNAASSIRFMLVRIKQNNGATSHTTANLLLNAGNNSNNYIAQHNPKYVGKYYRILRDWNVSLVPTSNTRQAVATSTFDSNKRYVKKIRVTWKKGCEIQFDGNAGTAADVITNNLAIFAYASDSMINFDFAYRIVYTP